MNATATDKGTLTLRGVSRSWRGRRVLESVELALSPGTIAFLGGQNGAGKTTLLRIAAGLITPDEGTISLCDLDPERDRREYHRRLGWLPAGNGGLFNRLTVRQNLRYWASLALVPRRARDAAVQKALEHFDLGALQDQRADRISMGERQRVRIAMAFLHGPRVVLMDEPHTSLDSDGLELVGAALSELAAKGGSAVWCAPARSGIGLPVTASFAVDQGRLERC